MAAQPSKNGFFPAPADIIGPPIIAARWAQHGLPRCVGCARQHSSTVRQSCQQEYSLCFLLARSGVLSSALALLRTFDTHAVDSSCTADTKLLPTPGARPSPSRPRQ